MEDGGSVISSASGSQGAGSSSTSSSIGEEVVLRIHVPELRVEKCLQFHKEDLVWDVKQQALSSLPKVMYNLFYFIEIMFMNLGSFYLEL